MPYACLALCVVYSALALQIAKLDQATADLIESDDEFRIKCELSQSVPGVGAVKSATLIAELSELWAA